MVRGNNENKKNKRIYIGKGKYIHILKGRIYVRFDDMGKKSRVHSIKYIKCLKIIEKIVVKINKIKENIIVKKTHSKDKNNKDILNKDKNDCNQKKNR